ncbi:MAG: XRE family transcriptional regulator [Bryobacteraceae bacterium]
MSTKPESRSRKPKKAAEPAPAAVAVHLAERVRALRTERKWSLDTLSAICGVSRSMLSQIERNDVNPTLQVIYGIAHAFGMSIGELVEVPGASSSLSVIRADDRAYYYKSDKDCQIRTLSPLHLEKDVEFYEVRLKQRGALRSSAHFAGTREFLTVQRGRVRVESGGDSDVLNPGDSITYRADVPHAIVNTGREEAVLFLVDIYRQGS